MAGRGRRRTLTLTPTQTPTLTRTQTPSPFEVDAGYLPISPLHLPYISPVSPVSPLYLPYISEVDAGVQLNLKGEEAEWEVPSG